MNKAQDFKNWCAKRQEHPPQIKLALEAVLELENRVQSLDNAVLQEIDNRDNWEERATKLAESVGVYFSESVGEHSSANCPINNAHELLNQIDNAVGEAIMPESVKAIINYINEGEPDLKAVKGELGELIARHNGTYFPTEE
jgi:predicted transcriptional regulator